MDMIGLSNMLRMDIDCIVHLEGTEPQVYHFCPDPDFPFQEEDKIKPNNPMDRKYPKMTVLNYKNNHYNLIVDKDSMLAQSGSFSFHRISAEATKIVSKDSENEKKNELSLKRKISELETTLKKVLLVNEKLKKNNHAQLTDLKHIQPNPEEEAQSCEECGKLFKYKASLDSHMVKEHFSFSHNCKECGKGFSQKSNLASHKRSHTHTNTVQPSTGC